MNDGFHVTATDLRDFAKSRGWVLLPEAIKDRLYVLSNSRFERRQLVFPIDATAPDYDEAILLAAEKLADLQQQPLVALLRALEEVNDDTLGFRIVSRRADDRTLPLAFAGSALQGAQQLLRASACSLLKPQAYHPRLSRTEAEQFINASRFRQTEPGSFVIKVSCPVNALDVQAPLLSGDDDAPFVRRVTLLARRALRQLVNSIEADTQSQLVADAHKQPTLLSSNFCEALTRFQDEDLKNSLEVDVSWAATVSTSPASDLDLAPIRIQPEYFPRIEEVRRALRSEETARPDTFLGTVERLDGEMGADGKRAGEVVLALLPSDGGGETIRARVYLDTEQYAIADQAHMTEGDFIQVAGTLHPGRQPRALTDVSAFDRFNRYKRV